MVWIILLLISLFLVFFFRGARRGERSDREAVVPYRHARPAMDTEMAEEPDGASRLRRNNDELTDSEFSDEFHRKTSMDFDGDVGKLYREGECGEEVDFDAMVEEIHQNMIKTPLQRSVARIHNEWVEPEWEIVGVIDSRGNSGGEGGKEILASHDPFTDQEATMEFASGVGYREEGINVYDSSHTTDYLVQIGTPAARISGFEMPIQMQLTPTLVALVKDPYWAFVYWVLPSETPTGNWELRVCNLTNQSEFFQHVDPGARRWYLHLNQPECHFSFELGVRDELGNFHVVLSSNEIMLPPDRPSNVIDAEWLTINELYHGRRGIGKGSPEFIMEFGGASEQLFHSGKRN